MLVTIAGKVGPKPTSNLIRRAACNPFWLKAFQIPTDPDPWENYVFSGDPNWKDIRGPKKQPPRKEQSCIHTSVIFFLSLIGIINDFLAHIPCLLENSPNFPTKPPSIRKKFPNRNCWVRNLRNVSSKRPTVGEILEIKLQLPRHKRKYHPFYLYQQNSSWSSIFLNGCKKFLVINRLMPILSLFGVLFFELEKFIDY